MVNGNGLRNNRKPIKFILGKGIEKTPRCEWRQLNKYMVNMDKLKNNILQIKYASTGNYSNKIGKTKKLNPNIAKLIMYLVDDYFDINLFNNISQADKYEFITFCNNAHINLELPDDRQFKKEFEILIGEYDAGNNNPKLKTSIIKKVNDAIKLKYISKTEGLKIINEIM